MTVENPKILIIGAGAIGAYYGARLSQGGADVSVVVRSDYDVLSSKGYYDFKSCDGDFTFEPSQIVKHPADYVGEADFVIVATKVLPDIDVVELVRPAMAESTTLVLLQNGVEIETDIQAAYPDHDIISGLCFICVSRMEPSFIDHQDYGHLIIGHYPGGITPASQLLNDLFHKANVDCRLTDNVVQARWKKLVWNAPYNPMTVLAGGVTTREIMDDPEAVSVVRSIMQEVYDVATAVDAQFEHEFIEFNIDATDKMKPYKPSMLLDYENNREMEVEAILGNAVRAARPVGVPVPHMDTFYALLKSINNLIMNS